MASSHQIHPVLVAGGVEVAGAGGVASIGLTSKLSPPICQLSQSCGSATAWCGRRSPARIARASGSSRPSSTHRHRPTASAQACGPPSSRDQVLGVRRRSVVVPEQCVPDQLARLVEGHHAVLLAPRRPAPPRCAAARIGCRRRGRRVHHASADTSVPVRVRGPGRPQTRRPDSASQTTTFTDWVEESTPATCSSQLLTRLRMLAGGSVLRLASVRPMSATSRRTSALSAGTAASRFLAPVRAAGRRDSMQCRSPVT